MPGKKNADLHGNAPDTSPVVLLLVDVINDLEFRDGERLLRHALPAARRIQTLAARARGLGIPVVYANDNFGRWRSDLHTVVAHCIKDDVRGRPIARLLRPKKEDYLVLKPKHSAFFASPLEVLLDYLGAKQVILAGFAGNICVLFTANDLYLRDYTLFVPEDCCASNEAHDNDHALVQMRTLLKADTRPSSLLLPELEQLARGGKHRPAPKEKKKKKKKKAQTPARRGARRAS